MDSDKKVFGYDSALAGAVVQGSGHLGRAGARWS